MTRKKIGLSKRGSFPDEEKHTSLVPLRTSVMSRDSLASINKRCLKIHYSWNIVSFVANRQWIEVSSLLPPHTNRDFLMTASQ
nr:MAG TPA: hypothetical protein [Caudoviricetes sp.]